MLHRFRAPIGTAKRLRVKSNEILRSKNASVFQKFVIYSRHPASPGGATRDRHVRGAGCGGRDGACDERLRLRTVKPCGSGAPKQASSSQDANASRG